AHPQHKAGGAKGQTRRTFLDRLGLGALLAAIGGQATLMLRALVPNVLYEAPRRFKVGRPDQFPQGVTFLEDQRVFIFREQQTFHAISAICTHLGCTVKMIQFNPPKQVEIRGQAQEEGHEFHCPCHGSKYYSEGTPYEGPAPVPLAWYLLEIAPDDGQIVVNLLEPVGQDFRLTV
ncbi:MAG: ubiquinol-cytochrome c reductase iron-sulfur subunit, partial [Terriglobia bacterium]